MSNFPKIILYDRKVEAIKRFHPWIFSGAIKKKETELKDGEIVELYSHSGDYLATGHYSPNNIAVKIFSFEKILEINSLFLEKFKTAYYLRKEIGLANSKTTNCYRLINAEGDGLPGLIVDWYNGTAVIQAYSIGMYQQRSLFIECLQQIYGKHLEAVYDKSGSVLNKAQISVENQYLLGERTNGEVLEGDRRFYVNWEEGQKTGFFIDQRDNRALLAKYARDRKILNTFAYSGGFSAYAASAGASYVCSVDSSAKAIEWATHNVASNNPKQIPHDTHTGDVFDFLKTCDANYDLIVLDPPAFAKNVSSRHQAVMAYKRLNKLALTKLRSGGMLFTFSCSQVVESDHFQGAVTAAAIESGKQIRLLHRLAQPADHPISIFHPEGLYLKGLVLMVG
jgi:23S rRNA (cytosine1962-C5)-methyltransferase